MYSEKGANQPPLRSYEDYGDDYGSSRGTPGRQAGPLPRGGHGGAVDFGPPGPSPYHQARNPAGPQRQRPADLTPPSRAKPQEPAATDPGNAAPHNSKFVTPIFPQQPTTTTHSCHGGAIMLEQATQTLEAIVGPLLEATLCECTSMGLMPPDSAVPHGSLGGRSSAALPTPPFDLATSLDLLLTHDWLCHAKFPVTLRKRLEVASAALSQLTTDPDHLTPSQVLTAEQAMRNIIADCLKAMSLPSLLGAGSRQFMDFVKRMRPEFESQLLYMDVLIADCQSSMQDAEARSKAQQSSRAASAEI